MTVDAWILLAFAAGLGCAIAYYKDLRWLGCFFVLGLPIVLVAVLGSPIDSDFEDTSLFSVVLWGTFAFLGAGLGTTAVVLRIVR